jgi:hypothetical protein
LGILARDAWTNAGAAPAPSHVEVGIVAADTTRKLATVVALDVAGYAARTEADEEGAARAKRAS